MTAIAVLILVIGIAVGFGLNTWTTNHRHHRVANRVFAGRHHHNRWADHNQRNPAVAPNSNGNGQKADLFADFDRMREEINRSMERAMRQLNVGSIMPDVNNTSGYSTALDVRDRGDHFEVRADLPNTDKKDIKVTTEGDRTVRVTATQHEEQKNNANGGQTTFSEFGSYDQLVTLPAPADMKDMKVDNRNGELVITIPKAKAS